MPGTRIVDRSALEPGETTLFRVREEDGTVREAILLAHESAVGAWLNACQHIPDVPLDRGDGATVRDGEIVCERHGAHYDAGSGACTGGPCGGAPLPPVEITVEDGGVYCSDATYEFVGLGGIEQDPTDLSSGGGLGF